MKNNDPEQFFAHTRMTRDTYDLLWNLLKNDISFSKQKYGIPNECKLAITLL